MAFLIREDAINPGSDSSKSLHCSSAFRENMRISGLFLLVLILCLSFSFVNPRELHADQLRAGEYRVKAAFLLNFANFIQWPDGALADDTFTIGVLGQDPFDNAIDSLKGKTIKGRRVLVRRYDDAEDARQADILFISVSEKRVLPHILKILRGRSVLTVGDGKGFGRSGVMINMLLLQKRVGFEINLTAANRQGLQISSQLLKLAQEVIE
jgi:hypothetical protein